MEVHEKDHFAVGYVGCSDMEVKCSLVKIISPCKNLFPCNDGKILEYLYDRSNKLSPSDLPAPLKVLPVTVVNCPHSVSRPLCFNVVKVPLPSLLSLKHIMQSYLPKFFNQNRNEPIA